VIATLTEPVQKVDVAALRQRLRAAVLPMLDELREIEQTDDLLRPAFLFQRTDDLARAYRELDALLAAPRQMVLKKNGPGASRES
jgi:hypothetical protein